MKYYYSRNSANKLIRIATIYSAEEHPIQNKHINPKVLAVVYKLLSAGYHAYIVGGALRDMLSDKVPKDFDVVTDALPKEVKKVFRRAQIVGKRFQIVLVPLGSYRECVEVSTFRADTGTPRRKQLRTPAGTGEKSEEFGSIEQDVMRRDFTCNALYYCPKRKELFDFVGGVTHLQQRKLVPIRTHFKEDPVRMLRAIKYACKVSLSIPLLFRVQIYCNARLLSTVSRSRISDEIMKILTSGHSNAMISRCMKYKLLKYMVPHAYAWYTAHAPQYQLLLMCLEEVDLHIQKSHTRIRGIQAFIQPYVLYLVEVQEFPKNKQFLQQRAIYMIMDDVKKWLHPITPPNSEVYAAIVSILLTEGLVSPHVRAREYKSPSRRSNTSLSLKHTSARHSSGKDAKK